MCIRDRYDAAEKYYKKALNLDPEHKQALEYQGELFVELGDMASAENNLSLLAELCPNSCEEYEMLEKYIATDNNKTLSLTSYHRIFIFYS